MKQTFMPDTKTEEGLKTIQLEGLKWTVAHAYHGSDFYRRRFDEAGVKPEDIQSLDDLKRLPFVTAQDLQEQYPWPLRSVPFEKIVRLHASSGTTGKRKVMIYTAQDVDVSRGRTGYRYASVTESGRPAPVSSLAVNDSAPLPFPPGRGTWKCRCSFSKTFSPP
ncbi:MAG: hypothetical protein JRC66_02880 [Deltaproteobacteria bacterium]|nr:hypothetical protein [Deltaproteobacteria bacterium]